MDAPREEKKCSVESTPVDRCFVRNLWIDSSCCVDDMTKMTINGSIVVSRGGGGEADGERELAPRVKIFLLVYEFQHTRNR